MLSEREAKIRDAVRCPKCAAEPGEPCFSSEGYYHVGTHWPERFDLYQATLRGELYASTRCHVCGVDTPHAHWNDEIGTVDVRMPAIILRRLLTNGEVSPTGLLLARLLHFLRRAKPTDAGTGAVTSGEAYKCRNCGCPMDIDVPEVRDAIKSAVASERERERKRCADWFDTWLADRCSLSEARDGVGSGADAPGAGKDSAK